MSNDTFQWTDSLVSEYAALFLQETFKNVSAIQLGDKFERFTTPEQFKASHTPKKEDAGRERDWEIISLKYLTNGEIYPFSVIPTDDKFTIHSVRRLSDNTVWTVGELTPDGAIERFELYNEYHIRVWLEVNKYLWFHTLEKLPPERSKLFTTSDGKDVFIGDEVYYVRTWDICSWTVAHSMDVPDNSLKTFSTEEKAKEFQLMNKPCLSVNDVKNCGNEFGNPGYFIPFNDTLLKLKKLAESKLST